jgi:hypothetical protein
MGKKLQIRKQLKPDISKIPPSLRLRMGGGTLSHIPAGEYEADVLKVEIESIYKRKSLVLHFQVQGGPHDGIIMRGFANADYETFSKETKVRKWLELSLDRELEDGEDIDLPKTFMNRILRVRVEDKKIKGDRIISNVTDILGFVREL